MPHLDPHKPIKGFRLLVNQLRNNTPSSALQWAMRETSLRAQAFSPYVKWAVFMLLFVLRISATHREVVYIVKP